MDGMAQQEVSHLTAYRQDWQALKIFSWYRLGLAASLLILSHWVFAAIFLGQLYPDLFKKATYLYFTVGILCTLASTIRKPPYISQVIVSICFDIAMLSFVISSSGGMGTGLALLLVITIAGASILTPGRLSFLYAAIASLVSLAQPLLDPFFHFPWNTNYMQAGLLGLALFITTLTINLLAWRLRISEAISIQKTAELNKLGQLNSHIIHHMHMGVIVVDGQNLVQLMNEAAMQLLKCRFVSTMDLETLCKPLALQLEHWKKHTKNHTLRFYPHKYGTQLSAHVLKLGTPPNTDILIFLEDLTQQLKAAQQLKLASIGRLTASIAHEIRNPLSAISHAAQLLTETEDSPKETQRLLQIIKENSKRTNEVITNILMLSRAKSQSPKNISLAPFLQQFAKDLSLSDVNKADIQIEVYPENLEIRISPSQLQQILTILSENGIRYSLRAKGQPYLLLQASMEADTPYLNVIDAGTGIPTEYLKFLFEPFFSTEKSGTGLGLYVARELCELNGVKLEYMPTKSHRGCFRLTFPRFE